MKIAQMHKLAALHLFGSVGTTIEQAVERVYLTERTDPRDLHEPRRGGGQPSAGPRNGAKRT